VVQVSGGALTRTSSVAPSIKIKSKFSGKLRVDTIFRAGLAALLFFLLRQACFFCTRLARCCLFSRWFEGNLTRIHTAAEMTSSTNLIEHSFELAAACCEDLTPLIYRRLFREHPEAISMFRSEGSELVKGSMLALTIDAILDFAGDRSGNFRMIGCEVQSHDAYGTPRKLFDEFFEVIADTLHEILGADWSPEIEEAWWKLLVEIDRVVTQGAA